MKPLLGIDFGHKGVGIAVSDMLGVTKPLFTTSSEDFLGNQLKIIYSKNKFEKIIVGKITKRALFEMFEKFLDDMEEKLLEFDDKVEVVIADETYSTWDARFTKENDKTRKKFDIDALSAEVILKNYIENEN